MDPAAQRLPVSTCLGWGIGSLGMSLMFSATGVLLLRYLVDYVGIGAALAGVLISVAKFYDAATDTLFGIASDRTHSRWGRRRPYLLLGGVVSAVSFVMLFNLQGAAGPALLPWLVLLVLLLNATGYALFNVPYLAMPGEMTRDYHERTRLMSFRVAAVAAGQLVATFVGPLLIQRFGGDADAHGTTAWVLAVVILLSSLLCFRGTRAAPAASSTPHALGFKGQLLAAAANRPFVLLLGVKLSYLFGLSIYIAVMPFLFVSVLGLSYAGLGVYFLFQSSLMLVSQPLWVHFTRRLGKVHAYYGATGIYCVAVSSWLIAAPGEASVAIMLRGAVAGLGAGGLLLLGQSMLLDTMQHDFELTGERREGLLAGIYTTVEKLSFSIGPAITGFALGASGYVASAAPGAGQPASARFAILACMTVVPVVSTIIGCLLLRGYRIDAGLAARSA